MAPEEQRRVSGDVMAWRDESHSLKLGYGLRECEYVYQTSSYVLWPAAARKLLSELPIDGPADVRSPAHPLAASPAHPRPRTRRLVAPRPRRSSSRASYSNASCAHSCAALVSSTRCLSTQHSATLHSASPLRLPLRRSPLANPQLRHVR